MARNKKIIIGIIIVVLTFATFLIVWQNYHKPVITNESPEITPPEKMVGTIVLYKNSKWGAIYPKGKEGIEIASLLVGKLRELNLQARCVVSEEDLERMKEKDTILELVFREPVDITITRWVEPEDRFYIPVDENGYRILEDVGNTLFILEDNLDEGLEAHILIGYGMDRVGYSCWAIKREIDDKLDRSWIEKTEKLFLEGTKK